MTIGIGIIGTGTVGSGVIELLTTRADSLARAAGVEVKVVAICAKESSELEPYAKVGISTTTLATDLIDDPAVQIVVELAGGYDLPKSWVERSLKAGKAVVTANKAMIAKHGGHLFPFAAKHGTEIRFEAAVGGAIPIIRSLREAFVASDAKSLACIINGTSNYILSRMAEVGMDFSAALAEAQAHGYAEADPTFDVEGIDAAHKVAILASLCSGQRVDFQKMHVEGITKISATDVAGAREMGCAIKLLGLVEIHEDGIDARVHPCLVPYKHPLAGVNGAFNAVFIDGSTSGPSLLYGKGAGRLPTASAVVADIVDAARRIHDKTAPVDLSWMGEGDAALRPLSRAEGRYYLRFQVADKPGVLGRVATILGENNVSVASMVQHEGKGTTSMVIDTHHARESDVQAAVTKIAAMHDIVEPAIVLRHYDRGVVE
ncbi:MAG: homoserine dehydrogenase [Fibrobacterota bacterium]|nr:homoserine dehydrogenase [Fibrobacterota bacterium]QQS03323.1 MAG: homoserine dehydrogenase [Fibrobacterota bacterium]